MANLWIDGPVSDVFGSNVGFARLSVFANRHAVIRHNHYDGIVPDFQIVYLLKDAPDGTVYQF